jgi:Delta24-sterol reductase
MSDLHTQEVQQIQKNFQELRKSSIPCTLQNQSVPSNITRSSSYKSKSSQVNINELNRVLSIDLIKRVAVVEPRVTMEELAKAAFKKKLMPPVVPEFKNITVGGAIMGTAIESSSHQFGLFSDNCLAYEILLGDGSIVRATAKENSDLFYGIVGSYGSLGIILSAEIQLITAPSFVKLTYRTFHTIADAISHMQSLSGKSTSPAFIEGIVYSSEHIVIIEGRPLLFEDPVLPTLSLNSSWSQWFYLHVKETKNKEEKIPLIDYLFRHDRGAFWMGAYATHPSIYSSWFFNRPFHQTTKDPSLLFRFLLGWALTSRKLYSVLHTKAEEWASKQFIIQDFFIPSTDAAAFIENVLEETKITPLWLCPVAPTKTPQILAPHLQTTSQIIDVGIYGIPQNSPTVPLIKKYERQAQALKARKMLYAYSYYSEEEFWKIYPLAEYEALRAKYHADTWLRIDKKVL